MRFWVLVSLGCLGCGAAPKPQTAAAPRSEAEVQAVGSNPHLYAEVMPTPSADALASPGLWLRAQSLPGLIAKLPPIVREHPGLGPFREFASSLGEAWGSEVAAVIDLAQPLDAAMPMWESEEEDPPVVVAFRVRSPEAIESGRAGLTLRHLAPGIWQIGSGDEAPPCLLAHAAPPVGFRVVCGTEPEPTRQLAPFLLRADSAPPTDLHLELGGPAYLAQIKAGLSAMREEEESTVQSSSEKLGGEIALAVVENLSAHESISLDASLNEAGAELLLDASYPAAATSDDFEKWAAATSQRRLPASFAQLPADADVAVSFAGLGKEATQQFLPRFLREVSLDLQQEFILTSREIEQIEKAFTDIVPPDAHVSVALGSDPAAMERALGSDAVSGADLASKDLTPAAVKQLQEAMGGWVVVGIDEPPQRFLPALERFQRINALPMKRRPNMPRKDSEREDSDLKRKPLTARGLPAGTLHFVDEVRPVKSYKPPADGSEPPVLPYDNHWLVLAEGQRVWIVMARSEALAAERARTLLKGARLGTRPEVQQLDARPVLAAMWFSVAGMAHQSYDFDSAEQRKLSRIKLRLTEKALGRATSPILATLEVAPHAEEAQGFHLRARARLGPSALTEMLSSVPVSPEP